MSARLEAATKQYGVTLLLTNALHDELSSEIRERCRPLDRVTVKGSTEPVTLYTHDTSLTGTQSCLALPGTPYEEHKLLLAQVHNKANTSSVLIQNNEIFILNWNSGFHDYVKGDWRKALIHMKVCMQVRPWDTPLQVLTTYIRQAGIHMSEQSGAAEEKECRRKKYVNLTMQMMSTL